MEALCIYLAFLPSPWKSEGEFVGAAYGQHRFENDVVKPTLRYTSDDLDIKIRSTSKVSEGAVEAHLRFDGAAAKLGHQPVDL